MARGAAGKLRRRNRKKEEQEMADRIFGSTEQEGGTDSDNHNGGIPMPPGMRGNDIPNDSSDDDDDDDASDDIPKQQQEEEEEPSVVLKKKKKKKVRSTDENDDAYTMPMPPKKKSSGGIKTLPLIFLLLMTGTTLLPVILYASDFVGGYLQKNSSIMNQIGFRLGLGSVPRKRVVSFYEKHDPTKLSDVPDILSKYYGEYPTLIKKLERKYQDYGYFIGWEKDAAPMTLALEQVQETYDLWLTHYWNVYAPQSIKTAARNVRYNLGFLYKKFLKVWKKTLWPALEPFLGVPKGVEQQKRKDAQEARKSRQTKARGGGGGSSSTRRRNAEFRDDVDNDDEDEVNMEF